MIDLNVKNNVKDFTRHLNRIQKKQLPFATARALTWTAQATQKALQDWVQKVFNVTKKWWLKQQPTGIKIKPAQKTRLIAEVYTNAYFADLQEKGGTKRPHRSRSLLIPTDKVPKSRRKAGGAAQMLKTKNVFSTSKGIYRRKGGKKRKNQRIELLFTKEKIAQVKPRLRFAETAARIAFATFPRKFLDSLQRALKTAR